jgi:dephospho-CoA kinase
MLKIGLTGGIGSGKSTVCKVFSTLGVPVYQADEKAKALIAGDPDLKKSIIKEFGPEAFTPDGYNSLYIAGIVFNNKLQLQKLNSIIHPFVACDFIEWCKFYQHVPYIIQEAAILFESGAASLMDYTIVVDSPELLRIKRVMKRDLLNKEAVQMRINNQWPAEKIRALADWVIENDDINLILPQLLKLHNHLLTIASTHA